MRIGAFVPALSLLTLVAVLPLAGCAISADELPGSEEETATSEAALSTSWTYYKLGRASDGTWLAQSVNEREAPLVLRNIYADDSGGRAAYLDAIPDSTLAAPRVVALGYAWRVKGHGKRVYDMRVVDLGVGEPRALGRGAFYRVAPDDLGRRRVHKLNSSKRPWWAEDVLPSGAKDDADAPWCADIPDPPAADGHPADTTTRMCAEDWPLGLMAFGHRSEHATLVVDNAFTSVFYYGEDPHYPPRCSQPGGPRCGRGRGLLNGSLQLQAMPQVVLVWMLQTGQITRPQYEACGY